MYLLLVFSLALFSHLCDAQQPTAAPLKHPLTYYADPAHLDSLLITFDRAMLATPHNNTFALFCVVSADHSYELSACKQTCKSSKVEASTMYPAWNEQCPLKITSPNDTLLVGVVDEASNTLIGGYNPDYAWLLFSSHYDAATSKITVDNPSLNRLGTMMLQLRLQIEFKFRE